ncbi:hypothetical protein TNCV_1256621 [Trichonephila clavipes]|nr:hypothetical protein TNCV_1256621 [Trichonephila clavipes]
MSVSRPRPTIMTQLVGRVGFVPWFVIQVLLFVGGLYKRAAYENPVSRTVVEHVGAPVAWRPRIINMADTAVVTPLNSSTSMIQHGDGGVLAKGCKSASGLGNLVSFDGIENHESI